MLFCRCCCCWEVYVCEQQQHVLIAIAISTNCPKGNSFCWKLLAVASRHPFTATCLLLLKLQLQ